MPAVLAVPLRYGPQTPGQAEAFPGSPPFCTGGSAATASRPAQRKCLMLAASPGPAARSTDLGQHREVCGGKIVGRDGSKFQGLRRKLPPILTAEGKLDGLTAWIARA